MLLTEYLSGITETIKEYSKTGLILSSELIADARTEKMGLIKGKLTFIDGSKLFMTEYLDLRYKMEKLAYSFHYQDKEDNLMFRYDNAFHKPPLSYTDHKHIKGNIQESDVPDIKDILEEIICDYLKASK
ncbi:MAG TPA: hypothetical protein ENG83_02405 [Nitrospirae bacterium]|nr:hypothetical protein BMS3Abin06_02108 [bacterium BMS3Abin06]HDH11053.1 hypothetical protein [Nitrospirota bacterium]HDZ01337.1 hypothetical protein [Nitrospirota bacterium]